MTNQAKDASALGSFPNAWTVLRIRGIPIRVDISWLIIAGLVTWLFFTRFAGLLGAEGMTVVVAASAIAALLFFASLLAHELGHALTSLDRGIPVTSVTLFLLGGVTESRSEAKRARDEFVIVGIGPYISLVLAGAFGLLATLTAANPVVSAVAGYLAWANLLLAIFNVIPGYPLDGGRLLRAILWGITGHPHRSTRWAARVGQVFAASLMGLGLWALLGGEGFGGIWEIMIGFFLYRAAADAHRRARLSERLQGVDVTQIMGTVPPTLNPRTPLSAALETMRERPSLLWPVGDPLVGTVTLAEIDDVPSDLWAETPLAQVVLPLEDTTIEAGNPLDDALARLAQAPGQMLIVVDGDRPVGLLTPSIVSGPA